MPTFNTINITYNPLNSKVYTHQISPNEVQIQITGEDIAVTGVRPRALTPQNTPVPGTVERRADL